MNNTKVDPTFHYTLHQKLWNILAENPGMSKYEALDNFFTKEEKEAFDSNGCAACTYMRTISGDDENDCERCPLDTSNVQADKLMEFMYNRYGVNCLNKLFPAWEFIYDSIHYKFNNNTLTNILGKTSSEKKKDMCSKYARIIANLPVRSGVIYD